MANQNLRRGTISTAGRLKTAFASCPDAPWCTRKIGQMQTRMLHRTAGFGKSLILKIDSDIISKKTCQKWWFIEMIWKMHNNNKNIPHHYPALAFPSTTQLRSSKWEDLTETPFRPFLLTVPPTSLAFASTSLRYTSMPSPLLSCILRLLRLCRL